MVRAASIDGPWHADSKGPAERISTHKTPRESRAADSRPRSRKKSSQQLQAPPLEAVPTPQRRSSQSSRAADQDPSRNSSPPRVWRSKQVRQKHPERSRESAVSSRAPSEPLSPDWSSKANRRKPSFAPRAPSDSPSPHRSTTPTHRRQSLSFRRQSLSPRSESPPPAWRRARSEGAAMEETVAKLVDVIGHLLDTKVQTPLDRPSRRRSSNRSERPSVARTTNDEPDYTYYEWEEEEPDCTAARAQQPARAQKPAKSKQLQPPAAAHAEAWRPALPDAAVHPAASSRGRGVSSGCDGSSMAADFATPPLPPSGESWEWPLSRPEKKSRVTMLDKNLLMADCHDLRVELDQLRRRSMGPDASSLPPRSSRFSR